MKYVETELTINAAPSVVWSKLTSPEAFLSGGLGILTLKGTLEPNGQIALVSEVDPKRTFRLRVTELVQNQKMVWTGGMPFGLFKGVRTYSLAPAGHGTLFGMREEFTGPMVPLIWGSMPDLAPSFEKFANGLKRLAENIT